MDTREATDPWDDDFLGTGSSLPAPPSTPHLLIFPLHSSHSFYLLQRTETTLLPPFMKMTGYSTTDAFQVLTRLRDILQDPNPALSDPDTDDLPRKSLLIAAISFLIFFALLIPNAYYSDENALAGLGVVFASVGLLIHLGLVVLDGDCSRVRRLWRGNRYVLVGNQRNRVEDYLAVVNKDLVRRHIQWKLGHLGHYVALRHIQ